MLSHFLLLTQRANDQFLFTLLFFDPDITPAPLSELPLTKYFPEPLGAMTARTGWDLGINSNTVVADMKIQIQLNIKDVIFK